MSRTRRPKTDPPDDLTIDEKRALWVWAKRTQPWAVHQVEDHIDACLDYHRAHGNQMVDWVACVRTWIRNERRWRRGGPSGTAGTAPRGGIAGAAQAFARDLGIFGSGEEPN